MGLFSTEQNDMAEARNKNIKQPPVLFEKTQGLMRELSALLGGRVISYWNGINGSVCQNDVLGIHELFEKIGPQETIYLFIRSNGGDGKAALRIVHSLREYCDRLVALLPLESISAGTMIVLGADEVRMGPMSQLSAVDTSLTHALSPVDKNNNLVSVSLDELNRVIRLWRSAGEEQDQKNNPYESLFQHVHPLVIGAVDRAEKLSVMLCKEILSHHIEDESKAMAIAEALNSNYPTHSYPILLTEAQKLGINAINLDRTVNEQLLTLNNHYSEMDQRAITDFDDQRYHDNEIMNIIETDGLQLFYQSDKDWFYRKEERRWVSMNDNSAWHKMEMQGRKTVRSRFHI